MPPAVRTPVGDAPVIPVAVLGIGAYLAWFGVHYWRSDVKYPTDPLKAVLQGSGLPANTGTPTADEAAVLKAAQAQITASGGVTPGTGQSNPNAVGQAVASGAAPVSSTAARNQQIGKMLAASYGWSQGTEWDDLVRLWDQESGWSNTADNPQSGAYGIPQALPYTKMPKAAWPPSAGGSADPTTQISWGLSYIKGRYGSASAAWAHEVANNWY
jgi:transglycosylase-like protein with SLT domain